MKLGLLTAAFPRLNLVKTAAWAADNGFEMLEVACWPASGGERRRYAGVSHIDVERFDPAEVRDVLDEHGLESRRSPTTRTTSIPIRASDAPRTRTSGR